jgi:hypothetical protein
MAMCSFLHKLRQMCINLRLSTMETDKTELSTPTFESRFSRQITQVIVALM